MPRKINEGNFEEEVMKAQTPVLVDFWAQWCNPCLAVAPLVEEISKEYEGKLKVCKIDVDENPQIASQYNVMSIPTLLLFKEGDIVDKIVGSISKFQLENFIKPHI